MVCIIQKLPLDKWLVCIDCGFFLKLISIKQFSKEAIPLHIDVDILNDFFIWYSCYRKKRHLHLSQKQMEISPGPPARNVFSFTLFIWRLLSGKVLKCWLSNFLLPNVPRCAELVISSHLLPIVLIIVDWCWWLRSSTYILQKMEWLGRWTGTYFKCIL